MRPTADLLAIAQREGRVLITDDKAFGELVFHRRLLSTGVLLIRLESPDLTTRSRRLGEVWATVETQAHGRFLVLTDRKLRIRPIPCGP